ncbi:MAG: hypothetical protein A3G18_03190 [Rhodospirillales bacterium RIFCSPLOWO2_12_FULL_58_28]|nr:MAG: hypothetical protein A3H92_03135 [Rhodospirillales bacterium RIFCSPLOWO2_02_FULL_58_16]OHC77283.1 MAG: hypothetical protein A3G18_03190 [Rhodospirillales bacterium RIFCSPLOWO2_12_FULL_58_28]
MTDTKFSRMRYALAPWLIAVVLLNAGCESPRQKSVFQDDKTSQASGKKKETLKPPTPENQGQPRRAELPPYAPPSATPEPNRDRAPSLRERPQEDEPEQASATALPKSATVRVALLLPLSGPSAALGIAMQNAAQLAMFSFADDKFELLIHDTKETPEGAVEAVGSAIGDGAHLILGPLLRTSVRAAAPAARAANVPMVSFSSDRTVAGQGVFTMGFYPESEVERVVAFARSRGITTFAALAPEDENGKAVVSALQRAAETHGARISKIQFYDPETGDFSGIVRKLANYDERRRALLDQKTTLESKDDEISRRALERLAKMQTIGDPPFEALLLADGGKRLQAIAALLPFYDIDPAKVHILGTGRMDVPEIGAEPALVGAWFAAPPPSARIDFEKQYQEVYGQPPPRLATLAYDATAMAAWLAQAEAGADLGVRALTNPGGFFGRDGIFRFLNNGAVERGLAVLKVLRHDSTVIDKAPETFEKATN